jgi:hypothetical protein
LQPNPAHAEVYAKLREEYRKKEAEYVGSL